MEENRYKVKRYGQWWWAILDIDNWLMLRVGLNPDYSKPLDDKDNKLLLFKKKVDAENYIKQHLL